MKAGRSIVRRLMLALAASIVVSGLVTALVVTTIDARRRSSELDREADDAVQKLARVVEPALWDLDLDEAAQVGAAFAEDPRVISVKIRDQTSGKQREIRHGTSTDTVARVVPVKRDGRLLGTVELTLSRASLHRAVAEEIRGALRASLIALLAVLLVLWLVVRRLLRRPLDKLATAVSQYDSDQEIDGAVAPEWDEFLPLYHVLGAMRERIASQVSELREGNVTLQHRNTELAALNRFLALSSTDVPVHFLLGRACEEITRSLALPFGTAGLFRAEGTEFEVIGGYVATGEASPTGRVVHLQPATLGPEFMAARAPLVVPDLTVDRRFQAYSAALGQRGVRSLVAFPMIVDDEVIGAIVIGQNEARTFSTDELALAGAITAQAASTIVRYRARAGHRLLRAVVEQSPDVIMIFDTGGYMVYANEAFTRITGWSREEGMAAEPGFMRSASHPVSYYDEMWSAMRRGENWRGRVASRCRDGHDVIMDVIIAPVRDSEGRITNYVAIESDATEEIAREERFRHTQRMDAVGQLAGGIAHDFNNILGAITMELELLELEHELPEEIAQVVRQVRASAQRAANLTRQLLMFSRRQVMTRRAHDLTAVVRELLRMLSRLLGEQIELAFQAADAPAVFEGDSGMIEQVIVNLCVNARDAMPNGGRLTVRTRVAEVGSDGIPSGVDASPGRFAVLDITDEGVGMSDATLARLFEPYFTTKDVGRGTGLGLATANGLVAQHHGWIVVTSAVGQGSTFSVYLPARDADSVNDGEGSAAIPETPSRTMATVLLVEDELALRRIASRGLRRLGYHVLEASNGVEAITVHENADRHVDLLLSDMVMPERLSGLDLAKQLREHDPSLKVVIMSGYDDRLVGDGSALPQSVGFLSKPFSVSALGEVVRRALDD